MSNKHLRYIAVATVARLGETSPDTVRRTADKCNIRVLTHWGERYVDAEDLPLLLGVICANEPAVQPQDGDR